MEFSLFDGRGRRKYLVPFERTAFLRAALTVGGPTASLCAMLTLTGARVSEVLALTPEHLDEANGTINIQTLKQRKKGVIRAVPVPRELFFYLDGVHHWQEAKRDPKRANKKLWKFGRTTAWRRVRQVAVLANSPQHLHSPKMLRHAFGVDARIKGVPIEIIQICLGHTSVKSTFIYTTVFGPEQCKFVGRTWRKNVDLLRFLISNSWGNAETSGDTGLDKSFFTHPGVVITAGTGDHGYAEGVSWPASSPNVVAVGGTSLFLSKNGKKYSSETAWAGTGSGCSTVEARPSWQPSLSGCPNNRTVSDISVVADPNTGVAIYNSDPGACAGTANCWFELGGTSVSSPIVAAMFALAGNVPPNTTQPASILYQNASKKNSHDITTGTNGTCQFGYLCTAMAGYDGPTGLGSPKGLKIFIKK